MPSLLQNRARIQQLALQVGGNTVNTDAPSFGSRNLSSYLVQSLSCLSQGVVHQNRGIMMVSKGITASQSMKRVGPNIVTCWRRLRCEEDGWALLTALVIGHSAVYPLSGSILSSVLWRSQQVMHEAFHHRRCGWRQRSV